MLPVLSPDPSMEFQLHQNSCMFYIIVTQTVFRACRLLIVQQGNT